MGSLAHTQVRNTILIQISDLAGEYGLDFLIVAAAAAITTAVLPPRRYGPIVVVAMMLGAAIAYGAWQFVKWDPFIRESSTVRIAIIQGNSLADWRFDAEKQREIMDGYVGLSHDAVAKAKETGDGRSIDLLVWPETTFRTGLREFDSNFHLPPDVDQTPDEIAATGPRDLAALVGQLDTPILVGTDRVHFVADPSAPADAPRYHAYNSSALVDRNGKIVGTYDKSHLVMFGEYIPFATWFPFVYKYLPVTGGTEEGDGPKALCTGESAMRQTFATKPRYRTSSGIKSSR